jgi:predicted membrane channel-forming protein YqfA (hemolysin III family)
MRKVFLKIVLFICLATSVVISSNTSLRAYEAITLTTLSEEKLRYEKIVIDGIVYIVEIDESGVITNIYPESFGGPGFGGN